MSSPRSSQRRRAMIPIKFGGLILSLALVACFALSPVYANSAWTVLVAHNYPGYTPGASYSLRGVATSPDGKDVYGTWLHTGSGIQVDEYDAGTGALLNSANISDSDGDTNIQAKSIAVDPRGYVFIGTGTGTSLGFVQALSADLQTVYGSATTPGDPNIEYKRFGGLATWDSGGNHYLYATRESGTEALYIQRFITNDVNNITLDPSFGTDGTFNLQDLGFAGAGHPHGIAVAADGTIYVASYDESAPPSAVNGTVYKIAPDLSSATSTSVPGAFGLALAGPTLYVSEYGEGPYPAVDILNAATLATEGGLDTGYTNTNTSSDSGYSGIAMSSQGYLYLADQFYSSTSYADQLLVSPPQPVSADSCKNGGWQQFTSPPGPFKNQGDCVSYFATGGNHG